MTLKDSYIKKKLGELDPLITDDGSFSLYNSRFNECFHSSLGALKEAREKFIYPAQLNNTKGKKYLRVLDVCVGLGYNTACLLDALQRESIQLKWFGLEIDKRPLEIALNKPHFQRSWSQDTFAILKSIHASDKNILIPSYLCEDVLLKAITRSNFKYKIFK